MYKYYTKKFRVFNEIGTVDEWINSFEEERNRRPMSFYQFEIVGYSADKEFLCITIRVFETTLEKTLKNE